MLQPTQFNELDEGKIGQSKITYNSIFGPYFVGFSVMFKITCCGNNKKKPMWGDQGSMDFYTVNITCGRST